MACESCKIFVRESLVEIKATPVKVELGEAEVKEKISEKQKEKFNKIISKSGLQVIESKEAILIEKIRGAIIDYVNSKKPIKVNFSDYLSKKLNYDYNYMSNLFTEVEANTITNYINSIKMEKAKELILFEDLTLSEVSEKLNYSNLSSFSSQFKKVTGFTPSHFKNLRERRRKTIQELDKKEETKNQKKS